MGGEEREARGGARGDGSLPLPRSVDRSSPSLPRRVLHLVSVAPLSLPRVSPLSGNRWSSGTKQAARWSETHSSARYLYSRGRARVFENLNGAARAVIRGFYRGTFVNSKSSLFVAACQKLGSLLDVPPLHIHGGKKSYMHKFSRRRMILSLTNNRINYYFGF